MQNNLRKSVFGAIMGVAMAVGFGFGATQLHANIAAAEAACDAAQVCPVKAQAACPLDAAKTVDRDSCPLSKGASI